MTTAISATSRRCSTPTPASICPNRRRRWSIRGWSSDCARSNLESFRDYCDLVGAPAGADERLEMLSALTTNVTRFFREPHHFEHLKTHVLPPLLESARRGGRVRLWSAACSTRPGALFDRADRSVARTQRRLRSTSRSWPPTSIRASSPKGGAASMPRPRWPRSPPPCASAISRRAAATNGVRLQAVADELRRLVAFRTLNLNGGLADAGKVPRHLLPQRRHLFRRADAADGVEQVRRRSSSRAAGSTSAIPNG